MFATNVPIFYELNEMPTILDQVRLDEDGGTKATLRRNQLKYYTSRQLMFNNTKSDRARKRGVSTESIATDEGHTKHYRTSNDDQACILCDKMSPASDQRRVTTMNPNDHQLHACNQALNDDKQLAKLSCGNTTAQEVNRHHLCLSDLYNKGRSHLRGYEKVISERTRTGHLSPSTIRTGQWHCKSQSQFWWSSHLPSFRHEQNMPTASGATGCKFTYCQLYQTNGNTAGRDPRTRGSQSVEKWSRYSRYCRDVGLALSQASEYSRGTYCGQGCKNSKRGHSGP